MNTHIWDFKHTSFGEIVRDLHIQKRTGTLKITLPGGGDRLFKFLRGQLIRTITNIPYERWGQWLIQKQYVSPWDVDLAVTQVKEAIPVGQILQKMGLLSPQEIESYIREWATEIWTHTFVLTEGHAEFHNEYIKLTENDFYLLNIPQALADSVRNLPLSFPFARYLPGKKFTVNADPGTRLSSIRIYKGERMIAESLSEGYEIEKIAQLFNLESAVVERVAYMLILLNWIQPLRVEQDDSYMTFEKILVQTGYNKHAQKPILTKKEILHFARVIEKQNPFEIFGIDENAGTRIIIERYHDLYDAFSDDPYIEKYGMDEELLGALQNIRKAINDAYRFLRRPQYRSQYREHEKAEKANHKEILHIQTAYRKYSEARQLIMEGRSDEAIHMLKQATQLHPEQSLYWERLGDAYVAKGDIHKAEKAYLKAWELQPYNVDIPLALARIFLKVQKPLLARKWARRAKEIDPFNEQVIRFLNSIEEKTSEKLPWWKKLVRKVKGS